LARRRGRRRPVARGSTRELRRAPDARDRGRALARTAPREGGGNQNGWAREMGSIVLFGARRRFPLAPGVTRRANRGPWFARLPPRRVAAYSGAKRSESIARRGWVSPLGDSLFSRQLHRREKGAPRKGGSKGGNQGGGDAARPVRKRRRARAGYKRAGGAREPNNTSRDRKADESEPGPTLALHLASGGTGGGSKCPSTFE